MNNVTSGQMVRHKGVVGVVVCVWLPPWRMCELRIPRPDNLPPGYIFRETRFARFEDLEPADG